jgi:ketosteroid isomerase-like protein
MPGKYDNWRRRVASTAAPDYFRRVADPLAVIERLTAAQNAHDLEAMLACFDEDYASEQPVHPARDFRGVDQVRANWSALLSGIADFHAEIVRSAVDGDTVFIEIHWTGTKADGLPFEERGVILMGIRDGRVAWGRLYVDEVEREGAGIDATVRHMVREDEP